MEKVTWKVGWYSKVVLTVIAVSLVGLLVRQLPKKVEAKPDLDGLKRLINNDFDLNNQLRRIESEIIELANIPSSKEDEEIQEVIIPMPRGDLTITIVEELVAKLQEVRAMLDDGKRVKITWR